MTPILLRLLGLFLPYGHCWRDGVQHAWSGGTVYGPGCDLQYCVNCYTTRLVSR